jgi:putative inorganic carbon (HCO3(-)) transporter
VVVGALFWLLRWVARGKPTLRTPGDWGRLGLLLMLPVSLWATALPERTLLEALRLLSGVILFYSLANAQKPERLAGRLGAVLGLLGVGLGLFALAEVDWGLIADKLSFMPAAARELLHALPQAAGGVHPNVLAGALVILIPFAASGLLNGKGVRAVLWGFVSLFLLGVLALTQSRGAYLACAAGLAMLVTLRFPRWGWTLGAAMALGLAAWAALDGSSLARLVAGSTGSAEGSLLGREEIWRRALMMIRDFPLTGVGMGSFGPAADALYPFYSYKSGVVNHAHNLYLQVAVDLGLPGLAFWLASFLGAVGSAWAVYRRGRMVGLYGLGPALLAAYTGMAVHGMVDAVTWGTRPAMIVWGLWGAGALVWRAAHDGAGIATDLKR